MNMNVYVPRDEEILRSFFKNDFDVVEVSETHIKVYFETDLYETLLSFREFSLPEITYGVVGGTWLSFEGLVSNQELAYIQDLEEKGVILCEFQAHTHILSRQGFFGTDTNAIYPLDRLEYWVKYAINDNWAIEYFNKAVLPHLDDIRLRRLFKK